MSGLARKCPASTLVALFMIVLLTTNCLFADEFDAHEAFAGTRALIDSRIQLGEVPSVAVAVVKDDQLIWAGGFGFADTQRRKPATPNTIYRLASISKSVTATGLMVLVDRGLVDLDAPANDYLRGEKLRAYVGSADEMTVRRLANHTAGMPVHYNFFYPGSEPPSFDVTLRRYGFAYYKPGSHWEYSNLAYGVIDNIISAASRTPWSSFMEREVYDPLGMTRTSDHVRAGFEADVAVQYSRDIAGQFFPVPHYDFDHDGASAVVSSVNDMARYARMHMNNGVLDGIRVLSETSAKEMRRQSAWSPGRNLGYGIAFSIGSYAGQPSIASSGGMPGVSTTVRMFPRDRNAIIVLTNGQSHDVTEAVVKALVKVLYLSQPSLEARQSSQPQATTADSWTGEWTGLVVRDQQEIPITLNITSSQDASVAFDGQTPQVLSEVTLTESEFSGAGVGRFVTSHGYNDSSQFVFRLRADGDRIVGRLTALQPEYFALSHWVSLTRKRK